MEISLLMRLHPVNYCQSRDRHPAPELGLAAPNIQSGSLLWNGTLASSDLLGAIRYPLTDDFAVQRLLPSPPPAPRVNSVETGRVSHAARSSSANSTPRFDLHQRR